MKTKVVRILTMICGLISAIGTVISFLWGSKTEELDLRNIVRDELGKDQLSDDDWDRELAKKEEETQKRRKEAAHNLVFGTGTKSTRQNLKDLS